MLSSLDRLVPFGGLFEPATVVFVLLALVALWVFARNYRAARDDEWTASLAPGEHEVDRLEVRHVLGRARLLLSDQRVVSERLWWPFSIRRHRSLPLADIHSVGLSHGLSLILGLLAIYLVPRAAPLALVLGMLALERGIVHVRLRPAFSRAPLGGVGMLALGQRHAAAFRRFYRSARLATSSTPAEAVRAQPEEESDPGFAWGRATWLATLGILAVALVQRLVLGHVSFDDPPFAALYLGLPVGLARRGVATGVLAAVLGFLAAFTVKFPGGLLADGRLFNVQAGLVLVGLVAMAILAATLSRHVTPLLGVAALLLWPVVVFIDAAPAVLDANVLATVLLAMAVAALVPAPPAERELVAEPSLGTRDVRRAT